ncbi:unnamed protein product (macronuclear) [Paramecium tetraurelia]|uniref:Uncharacterized protein n=1 Tax=Paramecium tetraurelia TaxID=5888 RepID=A0BGT8_PARTE|nr:uncharacterized protein GSPATT00028790001 [Paramecium tetraurelia]CAK57755.1 unnamed protein product [Paramecium tetraurelia]|eukprot:XP_001425153.1 hypothetical protein (macronuclear) [Paramecium tetraurelia strain d4-2]
MVIHQQFIQSISHLMSICLWDVKTGQQKAKLIGHSNGILSVNFSRDNTTLASGSFDNSIRLWDVKTRQLKTKLDDHPATVNSVNFSPDGTKLVSGSNDNSVHIWDVKTGQQILSSDNRYKDILAQFQPNNFTNNLLQNNGIFCSLTTLLISQQLIFQSQGALILKGEFINHSGINLKTLFYQRGSCILENQIGLQQKQQ